MVVGTVLRGPNKEKFAQPRVQYSILANVRDGDGKAVVVEKEITIIPHSEPDPPFPMSDFPSEFIERTSDLTRFFMFGQLYRLTVSMAEPSPVSLQHQQDEIGEIGLHIDVRVSAKDGAQQALHGLSMNLKNLKVTLQPVFRAKTFYATEPFVRVPGQDMVRPDAGVHLYESMLKLPEQSRYSSSWQQQLSSSTRDTPEIHASLLEAWSTRLQFPIHVAHTMVPTFCSYSIQAVQRHRACQGEGNGGSRVCAGVPLANSLFAL